MLLANAAAAVFVWSFVIDRVMGSDVAMRRLDVDIAINELRTSPLFPWLPTAELVVMPRESGAWRTTIVSPPRNRAGVIPTDEAYVLLEGVLLVPDGAIWRAHDLKNGRELPLSDVARESIVPACPELLFVLTGEHSMQRVHAIERDSGRARWVRDVADDGTHPLRVAPFGSEELAIGERLAHAATGAPREPTLARTSIAGDDVVWIDDQSPGVVMRRRSGGSPRPVLHDSLIDDVEAATLDDALILVGSRSASWAPHIPRRAMPDLVTVSELHGHDQTIVLALEPDDSVRWLVASSGGRHRACVLDDETFGVTLWYLGRDDRFQHRSFSFDAATGSVTETERACPEDP